MDDNAWPHRTLTVEELLESEAITRMNWPAYSPDLNPIEHVWDALGRRIAARLHHPEYTQQLKQMLIEEWTLLPQEMLHQLVLSMRRRGEATIAGLGSNPGEGMNVCKCIVLSRHGGNFDSRRAESPLVMLVEGEERWKVPERLRGVLPQNWGGTEQNHTVTCMVLKAKA
ncbi:retrovirus-related Pol polyprotein from transposon TNT 1-94 [Trichonephila clavipes]|nr:retrovirus-related Pol polyprotein from transposon TNT 1-94 [Trichonephila clavipes]